MKRITLGTVALLGALAVVTVKLPSVLVDPRFEGHTTVSGRGRPLVFSRDLKAVAPLVVTKGAPQLPPLPPLESGSPEAAPPHPASSADGPDSPASALPGPGDLPALSLDEAFPDGRRIEPQGIIGPQDVEISQEQSLRLATVSEVRGNRSEIAAEAHGEGVPGGLDRNDARNAPAGTLEAAAQIASPGPVTEDVAVALRDTAENPGRQSLPAVNRRPQSLRDSGKVEEPRAGYVLLEVAMRRHPMWGQLAAIEQEMEACKADWQRQVDASRVTEGDIAACYEAGEKALGNGVANGRKSAQYGASACGDALEKQLQEIEARLEEEASGRMEAHASEVRARLDDDLYAERARLNQEFDTFEGNTFKEYYLSLFNIQMKLKLLKLPEAERKSLQEKLANLTVEMQVKIDTKQREVDAAFAAYARKRQAEAEAEIDGFREQQERAVSLKLEEEQARLEKELADRLSAMESSLRADTEKWREDAARRAKIELTARREQIAREFAAREADFTAKWEALRARRDALYAQIRDDVRKAAQEVERGRGINVTVVDSSEAPGSPSGSQDLTEQALRVIRNW